jgi:hypothetical protein
LKGAHPVRAGGHRKRTRYNGHLAGGLPVLQASREIGAAVRMWLVCDGKQVVVFVWDASPQPPSRADPSEDDESGRGLLLVEAVSERWGHFGFDGGGKVVWAVIPATSIPGIDRSP